MKSDAINLMLEENTDVTTRNEHIGGKNNLQRIFTPRYAFNEDTESVTSKSLEFTTGAITGRYATTADPSKKRIKLFG